ncbi:FAD-dependent monooxygenase [Subtercola sp. YIM 133946]|uniref:FAD-dependent monooxygenase n=1 Tax=Subtercola sp. YIM 133946 TaxID=3118909 RepID=UPI002F92E2E4
MPAVERVLVVGAGVAGEAVAIFLADGGVQVDLIEQKQQIAGLGSGITLQGNALRVLRELGVWDEVSARGYGFNVTGIRAPDPAGTLVGEVKDARTGGPDLPAVLGMPRPDLAEILFDRALAAGVNVRLGTELRDATDEGDGVTVTFGDGSTERYDLVIGADGLHSRVRQIMGITEEPKSTGMAIWRIFTPRPASITRTDLTYGGPQYIASYCPTGENSLYAYIVEDASAANFELTNEERATLFRSLSESYHGPWDEIRQYITPDRPINYTFFETHLVDGPWNRGRLVIIGDAAHSCPPTLAQGAAQGLEDATVLAELLLAADQVDDALWQAFTARRLERAREVVDASVQLGQWLLDHNREADVPALMGRIAGIVSQPA